MAIAVVSGQAQFAFTDASGQSSQASGNFASNVTAGNLICGYVKYGTATSVFSSITDTLGNTYTVVDTTTGNTAGANTMKTFYARNIAGGANQVTLNFSGANGVFPRIMAIELSGCDTTGTALNAHEGNSQLLPGTGTDAITSDNGGGTATTTANCGIVAFCQDHTNGSPSFSSSHVIADGTGFSGVANGQTGPNFFDVSRASFKILAAAGAAHGTFTDSAGGFGTIDNYTTMLLAFKPPGGASSIHVRAPQILTQRAIGRANM